MAERRIIAYCMHEAEFAEVEKHLKKPTYTRSYAVGMVDEDAIAELESQGIVVEVVEEKPTASAAERARASFELRGSARGAVPMAGAPMAPVLHPTKDNVFVIDLSGPFLMEEWRRQIEGLGVELLERIPENSYTARLALTQVGQLKSLDFVLEVRLFGPDDSASVVFTEAASKAPDPLGLEQAAAFVYEVLLHRSEELADTEQWMSDNGVEVVAKGRRKLRVELPQGSELLREIQVLPEVKDVREFVVPKLTNSAARRLLGIDGTGGAGPSVSQTGDGETVGVADSGIDSAHPDLAGRIQSVALARPDDPSDLHGHGSHVAGSIAGDGTASNGETRGTAPAARLFFQSIMDADEKLTGLPVDLADLFEQAYQAGARIHNNSWSADTKSFYTVNSLELDEFVERRPDMLIVVAAGNEGDAEDPFDSDPGFVDLLSVGSPATAKNALTVGASRSDRKEGGLATSTYREFNPKKFPDPPIASQTVSGDPECLAAFSGRGPCVPRRIKPDVVAPGTDILSVRASIAPEVNYWGLGANPAYAFMGGTSMATPLVSGCAAVIREYYRKERAIEPSAALLKATIVNSTKRLSGDDALADHDRIPNMHQGFGAVYMPFAIPNSSEAWLNLEFVDTASDPARQLSGGGDRKRFAFVVNGGDFLRISLAWTDPAASADLQNILGVILEHGGLQPPKVMGNEERSNRVGRLDRDNNLQIIRVENPPPGNYLIQVFAASMLHPPQDFALVVAGDLGSGLIDA